jgi:hypothetical protein
MSAARTPSVPFEERVAAAMGAFGDEKKDDQTRDATPSQRRPTSLQVGGAVLENVVDYHTDGTVPRASATRQSALSASKVARHASEPWRPEGRIGYDVVQKMSDSNLVVQRR